MIQYNNNPAFIFEIDALSAYQANIDFTNDKGEQIHVQRRALSGLAADASGRRMVLTAIPVRGWEINLSELENKRVRLAVSRFQLSKTGVCELSFTGYEVVENKK